MTPVLFRRLILIWWALGIVCVIVAGVTESYLLPPELKTYQEAEAAREPTIFDWLAITLALTLSIGCLAASIGLYQFKSWARPMFLWSNLLALGLPPLLFRVSIETGFASSVYAADMLLTGGILFAMYLPPIGILFSKHVLSPKATNL